MPRDRGLSHPPVTFRSKRIRGVQADAFDLAGDLTIHGVVHDMALGVTSEGRLEDPWGGERPGYTATRRIKRSDFGLTWNQLLETAGLAVSDEVRLTLDIQLVKKVDQA